MKVLFNGGTLESFTPSRGIRQGNPLSPYIFIMCMEVLGFFIKDKCDVKLWDLVKKSRGGLTVSHLFFADDLVLFAKADMKNCISMLDALEGFCGISGQKISKEKSRVYFSPNMDGNKRDEICEVLGIQSKPKLGKYLGFSLKQPGSSSKDFDFVVERVQSKLADWKGHLLSFAGKVVLAHSVLTTILAYVMQSTLLSYQSLEALNRMTRNFIWGSTPDKRKVHMVSWNKVTQPKAEGRLGLQAAKPKNLSLLAKLNWRFKMEKDKDWAKVLRLKYSNSMRNGSNV